MNTFDWKGIDEVKVIHQHPMISGGKENHLIDLHVVSAREMTEAEIDLFIGDFVRAPGGFRLTRKTFQRSFFSRANNVFVALIFDRED